jgi:tRNA(adenine34) deaminase
MEIFTDEYFMKEALKQARLAYEEGEVPIGAVVVSGTRVIGRGYNQVEKLSDGTAHAEMIAITAACESFGSKYLNDCTMYVTIEPCVMCGGASRWVQLSRVVYGASEPKTGFSRLGSGVMHPSTEIVKGVMAEECGALMKEFFKEARKRNNPAE